MSSDRPSVFTIQTYDRATGGFDEPERRVTGREFSDAFLLDLETNPGNIATLHCERHAHGWLVMVKPTGDEPSAQLFVTDDGRTVVQPTAGYENVTGLEVIGPRDEVEGLD